MIVCRNRTWLFYLKWQWRGRWMLMTRSLIESCPSEPPQAKISTTRQKNPFPAFSLKSLSYHLHQTLQFLCNQRDCHLAVRRLDTTPVDVGCVSQSNASDLGDAQRPVSGNSRRLVIILPSCPLSPIARACAIRKCPRVSIYRTSRWALLPPDRQILCPQSGLFYLGRLLHFSPAQFIHTCRPVSCRYKSNEQ